ncbi:MAG: hypothetical protein ACPG4Y_03220 [Chitinophagales bacterium]
MIKFLSTAFFLCCFTLVFSQETKQLSEEEKQSLRDNHKPGLSFKKDKTKTSGSTSGTLNFTNSSEEKEEDVKIKTHVKYYHGTNDTLYKDFKYTKP